MLTTTENHDEQGMAMIMAMLIMLVCTVVVTASLALAVHSNNQSAVQRNATAALHAADYGLQQELASLSAQPSATGVSCTSINNGAQTLLPNTALPTQWYAVKAVTCTNSAPNVNVTILATGYAVGDGSTPSTTAPSAATTRTIVSHVVLQPSGALSNGGYGFPDAIMSYGAVTAASGAPLSVNPLAGGAATIRSDGAVTLASGSLSASLSSWSNVTLTNNPVTGNVASAKVVALNNSTVSGYVDGATVNLGSPASTVGSYASGTATLPVQPPAPVFTYNQTDWLSLTSAGSVSSSCPTSGTLTGVYYVSSCASTVAPTAVSTGSVALIYTGSGTLTVSLPQFAGPGPSQLYLLAPNGNLTVTDAGAAGTQVFAYASGTLTVSGTIIGQLVGGSIVTSASTTLDAELVSAPPDFSYASAPSQVSPNPTGFVPQITDQYLCPVGSSTAC